MAARDGISDEVVAEIGRYIAQNDTKAAVKKAKTLHGLLGTAQSEALLVDAYAARIRAMEAEGLAMEAKALTELVEGRYACARQRLRGADVAQPAPVVPAAPAAPGAAVRDACSLAADLADPDLPADRKAQIEEAIRREVTDLSRLAGCGALPADHPLRQAAGAVWGAFQAVTAGPVSDEQMALPEVSHRSPLADWKLLVRAIGCFYRRQDDACQRLVDAMKADSAAALLAAPLRAMLDGRAGSKLATPAAALVAAVEGGCTELRQAMEALEHILQRRDSRRLRDPVRLAVDQCRKARPELLERLKQYIAVRAYAMDCPMPKLVPILGGWPVHDAHFWRLLARVVELEGDPAMACAMWEEFRRHAVHQGLFRADGPEAVALYLHMVDLLRSMPPAELLEDRARMEHTFRGFGGFYQHQPPAVQAVAPDPRQRPDFFFLYPDRIFERLCQIVKDAEIYERWMDYARTGKVARVSPEAVAERWHAAIPTDSRPLLFLMEQAEERKAFTKALRYLQKAEALDGLSPDVKRARLRLCVANAARHLRDAKPHLAAKDFAAIRELPQSREADRPAVLAAMEWMNAELEGNEAAIAARRAELAGLLGGDEAAGVLLSCVIPLLPIVSKGAHPAPACPPAPEGPLLVKVVGRACAAWRDAGLRPALLPAWPLPLIHTLLSDRTPHDPAQLRALAETALAEGRWQLASAAAGAGLRLGGALRGRFLFLRARSLTGDFRRRRECLEVAAELARRQRDTELLAEVMDASGPRYSERRSDLAVADEVVDRVLQREADAGFADSADQDSSSGPAQAVPPRRRRARRQGGLFGALFGEDDAQDEEELDDLGEEELDEEEDEEDELEDDWDGQPMGPDLDDGPPPEVMRLFLDIMMRCGGKEPSAKQLERILNSDSVLAARLLAVMGKYRLPSEWGGPSGGFDMPAPRESREERRRRRKQQRRNRRR